ncbi:polycystic kidney disease and receptor for egg jelly-related protein [Rhinatrema bivittatum]|uniref:polycystic kidney disease and receptor for egg jelly-related protein n=1 Tax=Rhinatrema bivittatum TaxID=194408 RepID=UPI0011275FDF|nr:polycystic kidney disease and receptor for egg jelly-related protein [Rhinatrema bivittatum]
MRLAAFGFSLFPLLVASSLLSLARVVKPPPLVITCSDPLGRVYTRQDSGAWSSCLWGDAVELWYNPSPLLTPQEGAAEPPICVWSQNRAWLRNTSLWAGNQLIAPPKGRTLVTVQCFSRSCPIPACLHQAFTVLVAEQDVRLFVLAPQPPLFEFQVVQFGWCAHMKSSGWRYHFSREPGTPVIVIPSNYHAEIEEPAYPTVGLRAACASYYNYKVNVTYTKAGAYIASLTIDRGPLVQLSVSLEVEPALLYVFSASSHRLSLAQALNLSWSVLRLTGRTVAYQLVDTNNLARWTVAVNKYAVRADLCIPVIKAEGNMVAKIHFLVDIRDFGNLVGDLSFSRGVFGLSLERKLQNITLNLKTAQSSTYYFSRSNGLYYSTNEKKGSSVHYIFYQQQSLTYLFQIDFETTDFYSFNVHLYLNRRGALYRSLTAMDIEVHFYNSGPSVVFTDIYMVWFVPLQHPMLYCEWTFILEIYGAKKSYLFENRTYTYGDRVHNAAVFIPGVVLSFDPKLYVGFVSRVNFTKSGLKPVVLKVRVSTYAFKTIETSVYSFKIPCEIKHLSIKKPNLPMPLITTKKGLHLNVYASVTLNCSTAQSVTLQWKIFNISDKLATPDWNTPMNVPEISTAKECTMHIPKFVLDYGFYMFNVSVGIVTFDDEESFLYSSDSVIVEVQESDLEAVILGGSFRTVGFNDMWNLSGEFSADPDSPNPSDGLSYTWYCTNNMSAYINMTLFVNETCHPDQVDLKWLNFDGPVQTVMPETLQGNRIYYFRLVVEKGIKMAYADQTVSVIPGSPPTISVMCIENCRRILIPTERFTLSGKCLDCSKTSRPEYEWSLFLQNDIEQEVEVDIDWASQTSTGRSIAYMSIHALTFIHIAERSYTLVLKVTTWTGAPSIFRYSFYVNSPPRGGACNISPSYGIALITPFVVSCNGFIDRNTPLLYKVLAGADPLSTISSLQETALGIIVYFGYLPKTYPILLPTGEALKDYKLNVYVQVYDSLESFTQIILSVIVKDSLSHKPQDVVFNELSALANESNIPMKTYLETGDFLKLGQTIYMIASVLNNNISDVLEYPLRVSRTNFRESLLNMSMSLSSNNIMGINQIVTCISKITEDVKEINTQALKLAVKKIKEASIALNSYRKEVIGSEETERLSTAVLTALSNIMNASLSNINKLASAEASEIVDVLKQTLSVMETVAEMVSYGKVPGENETAMKTRSWSTGLMKDEKWDVAKAFLAKHDCNNCFYPTLPNTDLLPVDAEVFTVVYEFKENPLPWLQKGEDIATEVVGFQMAATKEDGNLTDLIPDISEMVIIRKNVTPIFQITMGPDKKHTRIAKGELGLQVDMQKSAEWFIQFFTKLKIAFNVFVYRGFNITNKRPLVYYRIPSNKTHTQSIINSSWDPYIINLPLKSLLQEGSIWNITVALEANYSIGRATNKLIRFSIFNAACIDFDGLSEKWNEGSCHVGPHTDRIKIHCICKKQQALTKKTISNVLFQLRNEKFVAAKVFVIPNPIDFRKAQLSALQNNVVTLATVLTIFAVYISLAIWARNKDKLDRFSKDQVIILPDNDPYDKVCYLVTFYTGSRFGAGTSADVFVKLIGTAGESQVHLIKCPDHQAFLRGAIDTFLLTTRNQLGDLYLLRIWHNNRGESPGWFLSRVKVEHLYSKKTWYFMCRKWLAIDEDDGLINRTFSVTNSDVPLLKTDFFQINTANNLEDGHLWFSVFAPVVAGSFNRLQRLSCCLAMLMSSLLTNIVLFNVDIEDDEEIEAWRYVRSVMRGIEGALVTVPVQLLVCSLFKYSQKEPTLSENIPYRTQSDSKIKEESNLPLWMTYVEPRDWKERLQKLYVKETVGSSPQEIILVTSDSQPFSAYIPIVSKLYSPLRKKPNNCIVSENDADMIVTADDQETSTPSAVSEQEQPKQTSSVTDFGPEEGTLAKRKEPEESTSAKKQKNLLSFMIFRRKKETIFYWWYIYVAWISVGIISGVSAFFIILYGLSYGYQTSMEWLLASATSFFQSVLVIQIVKITAVSALMSFFVKYCKNVPWKSRYNFLEIKLSEVISDADEKRELHYELVRLRNSKQYQPLKYDEITIIKKRNEINGKALVFLKQIISHFLFLMLVLNLIYSTDNSSVFHYNKAIHSQFFSNIANIEKLDHIYLWISDVFLPLIHNRNQPTFLSDGWSKIIGLPRIRQVRSRHLKKACFSHSSYAYKLIIGKSHCLHKYGVDPEDRSNYTAFWKPANATLANNKQNEGFTYERKRAPWIYYSFGELYIYSSGGYTVYFFPDEKLAKSVERLHELQISHWLNEETWAVIIELTTFNADVHLFCTISLVFEVTNLGLISKRLSVHSFTLSILEHQDLFHIFIYFSFVAFLIIYTIDEIYIIREQKINYVKKVSNLINFGLKVSFCVAVFLQIVKFKLAFDLLNFYSSHPRKFTPFQIVSHVDEILKITIGFLAFFAISKTLRYARFFYDVRLAQKSVLAALPGIFSMALVVTVYFIAYMSFGYLVFGQHEWSHNNLIHSAQTVLSYCVSAFSDTIFSHNKVLGGLYLSSFMLVMICVVINLFQAVIISAYDEMKQPVYEEPSDEAEVVGFLVNKLRRFWFVLTKRIPSKSEQEMLKSILYGQPGREEQQALGLKTKVVNGKKMVYLHI